MKVENAFFFLLCLFLCSGVIASLLLLANLRNFRLLFSILGQN